MKKILLFLLITTLSFSTENIRAVSTSQFTTEILLAIGAENQLLGTAYLDDEILPELKEKYDKIPVLSKGAPTKEQFYALNPNFLTGWKSIATPKNLGTKEELEENGVNVFFPKSQDSHKIEDVYEDILTFGDIFNLKENAKNVIENMKKDIEEVKEKNKNRKSIKVFAYDSQESAPFVVGGNGIGNSIIEIAGGDNIFKDTKFAFGVGTWEKVLDENPEFIVIVDYGNTSYDKKVRYLKNDSPIAQLEAVKKDRFIRVPLSYISSGIKISKGIEIISNRLSEDKK
ncbi:ABC transporter substrate-binding protein [Cetobacterium sp.]|uniref:ABC transporter substrate-binding protein n=1 Tax=Cetobacterium sp. TaxID=2071632 RepID=UPI003AF0D65D